MSVLWAPFAGCIAWLSLLACGLWEKFLSAAARLCYPRQEKHALALQDNWSFMCCSPWGIACLPLGYRL